MVPKLCGHRYSLKVYTGICSDVLLFLYGSAIVSDIEFGVGMQTIDAVDD